MISLVLLALLSPVGVIPAVPGDETVPVRILLAQGERYQPGDRVLVQVETGRGGHLLVLQLSPQGQVRVLFPLAPGDDASVRAGRRYELRDASTDQSFLTDRAGVGLIYAALAEDPFRLESFTYENEWDQSALSIPRDTKNPETDLTSLVQRMSTPKGFDYDLISYTVVGPIVAEVDSPAWWSPTYIDVNYGDPECFGCGYWGPGGVYVGIGFGFGWPWYYPWSPYPNGWPYGYYGGYYGGHYGGYYPGYYPPYYPPGGVYPPGGGYQSPWIVGRPRGYQVDPGGPVDPRARGAGVVAQGGAPSTAGTSAAAPARRARGGDGRAPAPTKGDGRGKASDGGVSPAPDNQRSGSSGGSAKPSSSSGSSSGGNSDRARPRSGRPRGDLQTAGQPGVERSAPEARPTRQWTRAGEWQASRELAAAGPAAPRARASGRQVQQAGSQAVQPVRSQAGRQVAAPQGRRVTPVRGSPSSLPDGRLVQGGSRGQPRSGSVNAGRGAPSSMSRPSTGSRGAAPSGGGARAGGGGRARGRP